MKLKFLGAAQTVTGSRILFEHYHFKGLVDCGLFQGPKTLRDLNWADQPELLNAQCLILTHAHIDHCGYIPRLYKQGYRNPIYCTKATLDLVKIMLLDSAKLQEEDARFANESKYSHHDPALPLYTTEDAQDSLTLFRAVEWNEWRQLDQNLSFKFIHSGHILGAAIVQMSYQQEQKTKLITFTGDLGTYHSRTMPDPDGVLETDYLVIESTYGNRSLPRTHIETEVAKVVNEVLGRQGTLVIPAFSVGRTQDLLYILYRLRKQNLIQNFPVYLDSPMAQEVTQIYLKHAQELRQTEVANEISESLSSPFFKMTKTPDESMLLTMSTEPKIVISASGMLQGGRVLHHLKSKLPDEKSGVLFVGFQAHGTKGRLLKEGLNKIRIHHKLIDVEATIYTIEGLSAHADAGELIQWMKPIQVPPKLTLVNHGEILASETLKFSIQTELGWEKVMIPRQEEVVDLESV